MQSAIRDSIFHSKENDDVGVNSFESIEKDIELIRESAQKISVEVLDQIVRHSMMPEMYILLDEIHLKLLPNGLVMSLVFLNRMS